MNLYVTFLIEDIQNAKRHVDLKEPVISFEEEMEEVEKWATGKGSPLTLSQQSGLIPDQFPSAEYLSQDEIQSIMTAFQEFLETWHMQYHFPENVPTSISYPLMVSLLNEEAWYLPGGYICHDFCTGYAPECDLKEYCPCLRIWEEKDSESERARE